MLQVRRFLAGTARLSPSVGLGLPTLYTRLLYTVRVHQTEETFIDKQATDCELLAVIIRTILINFRRLISKVRECLHGNLPVQSSQLDSSSSLEN